MFSRSALAAIVLVAVCGCESTTSKSSLPRAAPLTDRLGVVAAVDAAAVEHCSRTYSVLPGDTCDGISAKENVSTFQLASVNKGIIDASCSSPPVGETLCLGVFGHVCRRTRVVAPGDTCESIAAETGTTVALVLANNPNVDGRCSNVYPGEVLCTADFEVPTSGSGSGFGGPIVAAIDICAPRCCDFECQP